MAAAFDVAQGSAEFTWENTILFPWWPQQEGCCHSRVPGSRQTPAWPPPPRRGTRGATTGTQGRPLCTPPPPPPCSHTTHTHPVFLCNVLQRRWIHTERLRKDENTETTNFQNKSVSQEPSCRSCQKEFYTFWSDLFEQIKLIQSYVSISVVQRNYFYSS